MKHLMKIGILSLIAAQLLVGCGADPKKDASKKPADSKTKEVKKGVKVDPTAGCD